MMPRSRKVTRALLWPSLGWIAACLVPQATVAEPLRVAVEIHVEHSGCPPAQRRMVERISRAAAAQGIRVTFGFGRKFFQCTDPAEQLAIVGRVLADGNAATLHADLEPESYELMLAGLVNQARRLYLLGGDPSVASGVCTGCAWACDEEVTCPQRPGWVEAARAAGIEAVAGVVQYCYLSLDTEGRYGHLYRKTCADPKCAPPAGGPSTCHAHVPENERERLAPWKTETTAEWLRDDGSGLLIIPTFPDVPPHCFYEAAQGVTDAALCGYRGAIEGALDGQALAGLIRQAINLRGRARAGVFHAVWSTNTLSDDDYVDNFFQALRNGMDKTDVLERWSGEVLFVTLPQVSEVYR